MKLDHYSEYSSEDTARAESTLLTVWAALGNLTEEIVLVGGLVPRYICRPREHDVTAVTMDVDLGVTLELSTGQYEPTTRRLADHGFEWKDRRFVKSVAGGDLFLDFLTDKPSEAAAALFHAERGQNLAYEPALRILRERFEDARSKGPTQYAGFCMPSDTDLNDAQRRNRFERVNEALDAAHFLLSRGA